MGDSDDEHMEDKLDTMIEDARHMLNHALEAKALHRAEQNEKQRRWVRCCVSRA